MRGSSYYGQRYQIGTQATYSFLLVACLFCWLLGYVTSIGYPVYGEVTATPLWNSLCALMPGKPLTYLIGFLLMLGGAFFVQRANYALVLIREKSYLPFLLFALLTSSNPNFFPLKATSAAVFCLILALYQLFMSYHDPDSTDKAYNAAFLIGIGSLLWIHILWFFPLFWLGMYNFRSFTPRTFIASLLGVSTVYWFLLGWCVYAHNYTPFTQPFGSLLRIQLMHVAGTDLMDWMQILLTALLSVVASANILTHEYEDNLRTRQFLAFLILMLGWSFGQFFLYAQSSEEFLEISCIPAALLIAHFFTVKRGRYLYWSFYLSILLYVSLLLFRLWNS